jgi:hypothetical protein
MTPLYTEEEFVYPSSKTDTSEQSVVGQSWRAWKSNEGFILEYISGELAGRLKQLNIIEQEFRQLVEKSITLDEILIRYNCY